MQKFQYYTNKGVPVTGLAGTLFSQRKYK